MYLRNIRHALCFQIHIKAAASLFYSSTKGRIKPENVPLLSSLPRQRHIPLVCFDAVLAQVALEGGDVLGQGIGHQSVLQLCESIAGKQGVPVVDKFILAD